MNCPHCKKEIPDEHAARHIGAKGGKASRRKITPEQQRMMQAARNAAMQRRIQQREAKS
jgi:hypothetical protein